MQGPSRRSRGRTACHEACLQRVLSLLQLGDRVLVLELLEAQRALAPVQLVVRRLQLEQQRGLPRGRLLQPRARALAVLAHLLEVCL